jgi:exosortase
MPVEAAHRVIRFALAASGTSCRGSRDHTLTKASHARHAYFALGVVCACLISARALRSLIDLAAANDVYTHALLVPLIAGCLMVLERRRIFIRLEYRLGLGAAPVLLGLGGVWVSGGTLSRANPTGALSLAILSLVLLWSGGFIACYGPQALKAATLPFLLLVLMVPLPDFLLARVVSSLQQGSALVTYGIFKLLGVPVLKEGLVFSLPGVTIEVAEECSGIRSSWALLITGLLAGHFFLRSVRSKLCLVLATVPIAMLKNGLRIATISLLSTYVNRDFLTGELHRNSGIPFSIIGVGFLVPLLRLLQRSEAGAPSGSENPSPAEPLSAVR